MLQVWGQLGYGMRRGKVARRGVVEAWARQRQGETEMVYSKQYGTFCIVGNSEIETQRDPELGSWIIHTHTHTGSGSKQRDMGAYLLQSKPGTMTTFRRGSRGVILYSTGCIALQVTLCRCLL